MHVGEQPTDARVVVRLQSEVGSGRVGGHVGSVPGDEGGEVALHCMRAVEVDQAYAALRWPCQSNVHGGMPGGEPPGNCAVRDVVDEQQIFVWLTHCARQVLLRRAQRAAKLEQHRIHRAAAVPSEAVPQHEANTTRHGREWTGARNTKARRISRSDRPPSGAATASCATGWVENSCLQPPAQHCTLVTQPRSRRSRSNKKIK